MRCGGLLRRIQKTAVMKISARTRPMMGATTMKIRVLYHPAVMITLKLWARMMAAPAMPLLMVLATAVPNKNAATKLKKAAQRTAILGERTRVETTVAMLLAAS